jgi:hypothetical protein
MCVYRIPERGYACSAAGLAGIAGSILEVRPLDTVNESMADIAAEKIAARVVFELWQPHGRNAMGNADLDGIPLFAGLSPEERARVASLSREMDWPVGHVALQEGEFAFDFYAIKHGAVEVQRQGQRLAVLGDGDFFGELGVVPYDARHWTRRRNATVVVTAPTRAVAIPGSEMRRLTEEIPPLAEALRRVAAERTQTENP